MGGGRKGIEASRGAEKKKIPIKKKEKGKGPFAVRGS